MKRLFYTFVCLSLSWLFGIRLSCVWAQEAGGTDSYPVSLYGLVTSGTAPGHPAVWTEFQLPANSRDTLNKLYLRTDGTPLDIEEKYDDQWKPIPVDPVELQAIGFDFPYGGRTMTHFGLTGNGLIYLGATSVQKPDEVELHLSYKSSISSLSDAIAAVPYADVQGYGYPNEPYFVADNQTKIGYYQEPSKEYLVIGFRDLLVGFTVPGNQWVTPPTEDKVYNCRWTYDVVLYKDGRVMLRFVDAELPVSDKPLLYFVYGMFGQTGESSIFVDENGKASVVEPEGSCKYMTMTDQVKNTVWTYETPQPCTAPSENVQVTENVTELYSTDFKATLTVDGCDGWLAFISDNEEVSARPEDGKTYSTGSWNTEPDEIGGIPVKIFGRETEIAATGLHADSRYFIYVYPYNAQCLGGPVYRQEPIKKEVRTSVGGPDVEMASITATSATFRFPELAAGTKVLVGIARRDYRNETYGSRYEIDGISGKTYKKGDTLFFANPDADASMYSNQGPYVITVAHVGTVADHSLTINELEAGTPYYFYFWTALEAADQYSKEYVEKSVLTVPATPFTFTYATDRAPIQGETGVLPAGWSCSEGMEATFQAAMWQVGYGVPDGSPDERRALGARLVPDNPMATVDAVRADVITPAFRSTHTAFDLRYRVQMQASNMMGSSLSQFGEEDSLTVWYREIGQTGWKLVSTVTSSEPLEYASDDYATLKAVIQDVPQDRDVQLRFMIRATPGGMMSSKIFVLHHVLVEPHLDCAYPENIMVFDSLTTHRTIGLSWQNENMPASSVVYRYRIQGEESWSEPQLAQQPALCVVPSLQANTTYEVALQSVCRSGDSSFIKSITANTLRGLPYKQALTDLKAWPEGMEAETGTLPAEGDAETRKDTWAQGFAVGRYSEEGHTAAGVSFNIYPMQEYWLKWPVLCMEDMEAPAELSFRYKAFYRENGTGEPVAVDAASSFHVLVLVSRDASFSSADIVGELQVKDMKTDYQPYTVDLSDYTRQIYVALYAENLDQEDGNYERANMYFILDSLSVRYTAGIPCYPVENIRQYGLSTTGITLSWDGSSLEYGIILTNEDKDETDTVYTDKTTYTFTDLEPGTLYTYRIQGYCEDGHRSPSALSEEGFFTTRDICAVPADFAVLGTTWQSVTVTAKSSADKLVHIWGKEEAYAHLDYKISWSAGNDTLTLTGLFEALHITYCIAVRSVCSAEDSSAWTQTLEFTTDRPECGAPTDLTTVKVGYDFAELSWKFAADNDYVELMYRPAEKDEFDTVAVAKTEYRLSGLEEKTAYVWQLQAVCDQYLVSPVVKGADFTTQAVAVEQTSMFAGLKVGSDRGRIIIWNADALPLDRVEVYDLTGRVLYGQDFHTVDHLWLPVLGNESRTVVLVRVFSAGETAVYKIALM